MDDQGVSAWSAEGHTDGHSKGEDRRKISANENDRSDTEATENDRIKTDAKGKDRNEDEDGANVDGVVPIGVLIPTGSTNPLSGGTHLQRHC
jgi:hypothetical protein